jgi:enolase
MAKISSFDSRPILDSRGEWTVEVTINLDNGLTAKASVPQGKSRGSFEAACVKPEIAAKNVKELIEPALKGLDPSNQKEIDETLIKLDGTLDKSKLGANAILGVSIASARAAAMAKEMPLWKHLRELSEIYSESKVPRLYVNVINGGMHSGNNLDFQEYLIIPKKETFKESVEVGVKIYKELKKYLENNFGKSASALGDEGGFAPDFKTNIEPFEILSKVAESAGLRDEIDFGLDAAASDVKMETPELLKFYNELKEKFGILYLEDPFPENDFEDFAKFTEKLGTNTFIVGDDLTTTNVNRMRKALKEKSINGIIIKPNQIGTISESLEAIKLAKISNWKVIVSHRSGETNDDFIADLAYGVMADGIKLGAPARGERIAKYNRLLEIEKSL